MREGILKTCNVTIVRVNMGGTLWKLVMCIAHKPIELREWHTRATTDRSAHLLDTLGALHSMIFLTLRMDIKVRSMVPAAHPVGKLRRSVEQRVMLLKVRERARTPQWARARAK